VSKKTSGSVQLTPASAQLQLTAGAPALVPSLAQLLAAKGKVRQADLALFLAALSAFHVALGNVPAHLQSSSNVPVPAEVLDTVGGILVGRGRWAAIQNAARAKAKDARKEQLQQQADEVWRRHPGLSKAAVAKKIAPGQANARRLITKKK
jgi:hypothetical protein